MAKALIKLIFSSIAFATVALTMGDVSKGVSLICMAILLAGFIANSEE